MTADSGFGLINVHQALRRADGRTALVGTGQTYNWHPYYLQCHPTSTPEGESEREGCRGTDATTPLSRMPHIMPGANAVTGRYTETHTHRHP
ncbi:hypothetical protein Pcinc_031558 [Petrolisthes cinctipes]|uniref:Uncharacterized protein n=1 Tax=Petrolisthes cinctipes TaxID=88211 RepID=A0AAE1EWD0_PETCI|nr:hypothetical protein Pcinc_031558 [Petrolisthes cinctipes]